MRQLFHHAWPILIAQLLSMAMMIADTLIAGRYGTLDLAGVAIGSSFYISVVMLMVGILQAVAPTVAHHVGAGRRDEIGPSVQQGFWLALGLAATMDTVGSWWGEPPYGPGQTGYVSHEFADNGLSHSEPRYQAFRQLYEQHPQIKLGGVTAHWIREGIKAGDAAIAEADRIKTPLLLIQAGEDGIVDNQAQDSFCDRLQCEGGKPLRIEGAWHELFIEADAQRLPALTATLDFFARF